MQYKNIDPSGDWSKLELLNYQDILEDVLTSNHLLFNFEDPDSSEAQDSTNHRTGQYSCIA